MGESKDPGQGAGSCGGGEGSARRPGEGAPGEEVKVQVGDGFTGVGTLVDDEAKALGQVELFGQFPGDQQEVSEEGLVGRIGLADAGNGFAGDQEKMEGSLGADIVQSHAMFILVGKSAGNLSGHDFFKKSHGFRQRGGKGGCWGF